MGKFASYAFGTTPDGTEILLAKQAGATVQLTAAQLAALVGNTAWTTYTPTVTAGTGTATTVSATGRYKQIGKTVIVQASVTVTSVGTAASNMQISVPITASTAANYVGSCFESGISGKSGAGVIQSAFPTKIYTTDATGATWWASGKVVDCTVTYEIP